MDFMTVGVSTEMRFSAPSIDASEALDTIMSQDYNFGTSEWILNSQGNASGHTRHNCRMLLLGIVRSG
jgi:hypothetical protein